MNNYKCKLIPLDRLPIGPMGPIVPLCNNCETKDCSNPIEPVSVTVFGSKVNWKVYKKKGGTSIVAQCEGYSR